MSVTQEPLIIQYLMPLMTYPHIGTKIILGLQSATDGLQSVIGLEVTKYDKAWLQIAIGFGLQSATKILKNGLQSTMGLQTVTDYKVIQYNYKFFLETVYHDHRFFTIFSISLILFIFCYYILYIRLKF